MGRHSDNAQEKIIDAAEDVVIEVGAHHLTLDAVAAKAGVSKGGLMYHFPNKEALIDAMVNRRFERTEEYIRNQRALLEEGQGKGLIAYILSCLEHDHKTRKLSAALLAAVAHNPKHLLPYRKEYRRLLEEFAREGIDLKKAAMVMLAVDDLRFMELLSLSPFTDEERSAVIEEIIGMAKYNVKD